LSPTQVDLNRIRVRFATFRDDSAQERERLAQVTPLVGAAEHLLLHTCHRVELVSVDDTATDVDGGIAGRSAVSRVFEVVAGFDSAVIAEEQLLGQVRGAYEAALAAGSTGPILNELFRRSLRFGRRVRSHARPGSDRSLADRGAAWLIERISDAPASVIVAGTGEMGRLAATLVAKRGHRVSVVSASAERGGRLLEALPGDGHRLTVGSVSARHIAAADALVLAVRSHTPVVTAELIGRARPWVLDMSSPGAVDAGAAERLADQLMTLDSLGAVAGRTPVLSPAVERRLRADLEREVDEFVAWLDARRGAGALEMLHAGADAVRQRHLARLRRRTPLDARQLRAVEAAATAMVGELLHGPSIELRRDGTDAETVRRLFGLEE